MSEIVFILGAGASREAGAPLMNDFLDVAYDIKKRLPDHADTLKDFNLVFKGIAALEASVAKANIDLQNVESVFAAFEMAKLLGRLGSLSNEEINSLPTAMTKVIETTLDETISLPVATNDGHRTVAPPVPYGAFVEMIRDITDAARKPRMASVITFNYDICLDYAFHYYQLPVNYCLDEKRKEGTRLLKLHGSTNWALCSECRQVVPWHMEEFFSKRTWRLSGGETSVKLDVAGRMKEFKHCIDTQVMNPLLVPPTWNKAEHHNQLSAVWRAAACELSEAENVIVSGYSLPESDHFFRYLYALGITGGSGRLKRFLVFDPDREVEKRSQSLLGPMAAGRFSYYQHSFGGAIGTVRNILGVPEKKEGK